MVVRRSKQVALGITAVVAATLIACSSTGDRSKYACVGPNNQIVSPSMCGQGGSYFWYYPYSSHYVPLVVGGYVNPSYGYRETPTYGSTRPSSTFRSGADRSYSVSRGSSVSKPSGTVARGRAGTIGSGRGFSGGS